MTPTPQMLAKVRDRLDPDGERYEDLDWDRCMLCGATGPDKRTLLIRYFYKISEQVPEAIDLSDVDDHDFDGYLVRTCKNCRGSFLARIREWRNERVANRGFEKDHDGHLLGDREKGGMIPVRQDGRTVYMSESEYERKYGDADDERYEIQCGNCSEPTGIQVSYPPEVLRMAERIMDNAGRMFRDREGNWRSTNETLADTVLHWAEDRSDVPAAVYEMCRRLSHGLGQPQTEDRPEQFDDGRFCPSCGSGYVDSTRCLMCGEYHGGDYANSPEVE